MATFEGFGFSGFKSPEQLKTEQADAFQQQVASGNKDQMRMAIAAQAARNITGTPEMHKARKIQKVMQQSSEAVGGTPDPDDLAAQKKYYAEAHRLAVEAGLPEVAVQAQNALTQLAGIDLERQSQRAGIANVEAGTESTSYATLRNRGETDLQNEVAALDYRLSDMEPDDAGYKPLVARKTKLQSVIEDKRLERERGKRWKVGTSDLTNEEGVPVRRTYRYNEMNSDEIEVMGEVPIEDLNKAASAGGREWSATIERIANQNRLESAELNRALGSARMAYRAAGDAGARGLKGAARSQVLAAFGAEDMQEVNKKLIDAQQKVAALKLLPPGPASDRDVEMVRTTQLGPNSGAAAIQEHLRGTAKLAAMADEYYAFVDEYIARGLTDGTQPTQIGALNEWKAYYEENQDALWEKVNKRIAGEFGYDYEPPQAASDAGSQTAPAATVVSVKTRGGTPQRR